jgi:hypothetical protein
MNLQLELDNWIQLALLVKAPHQNHRADSSFTGPIQLH